jgi:hypothetical protein
MRTRLYGGVGRGEQVTAPAIPILGRLFSRRLLGNCFFLGGSNGEDFRISGEGQVTDDDYFDEAACDARSDR